MSESVIADFARNLPALYAGRSPERKREFLTALCDRIVIRGQEFVEATLTPWAERRAFASILQERVNW